MASAGFRCVDAAQDLFGSSVAIDGSTVIAGAPSDDVGANPNQGSAVVFFSENENENENVAPVAAGCDGVPATIVGTGGSDTLNGNGANDVIVGRGGDDRITAGGGIDRVCGGSGNDTIDVGSARRTAATARAAATPRPPASRRSACPGHDRWARRREAARRPRRVHSGAERGRADD